MTDYDGLRGLIDEEGIEFVDFRVTDLTGRFRHVTIPVDRFTESLVNEGVGFDGSNYGYRGIGGSDMVLLPDLSTAYIEERDGEKILTLIGDVCEAKTRRPAEGDPRRIAAAAVSYLRERGIADDLMVSPEFEFYVFAEVRYELSDRGCYLEISPAEGDDRAEGGLSAYHLPLPEDRLFSLRCEITRQIEAAGIKVKYHHHEVGRLGQHEIELGFESLSRMADAVLIVKSIVRNVASELGLTATFLPKPLHNEAGNGMHLHQYLVKGDENLFEEKEGGLSDLALCYVGGILTHGRSLMGLTNPSTNSYRRLVPGYEAPVNLVFGSGNRSAAIRVPTYASGDKTRIELRTVDATCNPYLAFAAILMAGIDGIDNGLDAKRLGFGPYDETDLYEDGTGERAPRSLLEALTALEEDHDYLLKGGVFSEELLEHWIASKQEEAAIIADRPHPHEFALYYDL